MVNTYVPDKQPVNNSSNKKSKINDFENMN